MKFRLKKFKIISIFTLTFLILILLHQTQKSFKEIDKNCRDWHDYDFIAKERRRVGLGEHGEPFNLTNPREIEENQRLFSQTGMSAVISNKISVNRSIPDHRNVECQNVKYPSNLPNVSVIIIFHNEILSVLLRTVHSVVNRTPRELLKEVILVNDNSTNEELYGELEGYVRRQFGGLVRVKKLNERKGLIVTRLEGAEIATGEILVFLE